MNWDDKKEHNKEGSDDRPPECTEGNEEVFGHEPGREEGIQKSFKAKMGLLRKFAEHAKTQIQEKEVNMKEICRKIRNRLMIPDKALSPVSAILPIVGVALLLSVVFFIYFDYNQLATIGGSIINAFAGVVMAIPNVITNFIYSVGAAFTGQAVNAVNGAGTAITNAWNSFIHWLTTL